MVGWPWSVRAASAVVALGLALAGYDAWAVAAPEGHRAAAVGSRAKVIGAGQAPAARQPRAVVPKVWIHVPEPTGYTRTRGPNTSSRVVLSYDDCPKSRASFRSVVQGAERLGIALMLFPTGECLRGGTFQSGYARAHGHYVFNHSVGHLRLSALSYAGVLGQLDARGVQSRYGRPPFGDWNATVSRAYQARGMKMWLWSLDTRDWQGHSQTEVVHRVIRSAKARDTVLMHMQWRGFSVAALSRMQDGLAARGLQICRNHPGTTPTRSWKVRC